MGIDKLNRDLNIISSLPTCPSSPEYDADTLKRKFDESANIIKEYINDSLIPQILNELAETVLSEGGYKYIPCRTLLQSYTSSGTYTFNTEDNPSFTGVYDVVLIGAGGGGYIGDGVNYGGGAGGVTVLTGVKLNGEYTLDVGAAGECSSSVTSAATGGSTLILPLDAAYDVSAIAFGGEGGDPYNPCAPSGGVGGGNAIPPNGGSQYGAGGDCYGYGCGAAGAALNDDVRAASGYGGGGWGLHRGKGGAVFIYGYTRQEE